MKPAPTTALLIACTYERSPYPTLEWAAADVVAIARMLVRHCGCQRVIVLHRRPHPFFTEGELGSRDVILDFARQLVPRRNETTPDLAFNISNQLRIPEWNHATLHADEVADLRHLLSGTPTPEEFDSIESLVVAVLNRWLGYHPDKTPPPTDEKLLERRLQIARVFPQLGLVPTPDSPLTEGAIEFRGVPTPDAIQRALIELDSDPDSGDPIPMLFTAVCGHGIHHRDRNCLLLPDSRLRFLDLTSLPIKQLVRWSGSHCLFIDACQVPVDPDTFPSGNRRHRGRAAAPSGIGARDYGGQRARPQESSSWSIPPPPAPSEGAVALLHTCWPGKPARELSRWRHGLGTRCFLEALRNSAWTTEPDSYLPTAPVRLLAFEEIARQVCREVQQSSWTLARSLGDGAYLQAPFLHRAGSAESLVLARITDPIPANSQDPRLWIHPPRLDDIHASRPFRNNLGIPFVHLREGKSLMACWTVRNRDFALFLQDNPGCQAPKAPDNANQDWPRTHVTLAEAIAFCDWLTKRDIESGILLPSGFAYDLPTDGEWDRAAGILPLEDLPPIQRKHRARRPWREEALPPGFCFGASNPIPVQETARLLHPVAEGMPLAGLCGLAGNVWEMTRDAFDTLDAVDPRSFQDRITVRGQSFSTPVHEADLTLRLGRYADSRHPDVGFRLVLRRAG